MKRISLYLVCLLILTSCLEVDMKEKTGFLSPTAEEIIVPSDMKGGRNLVADTLYIESNRTWTSSLSTPADWISVETDGHRNLACISDISPVILKFKDNETDEPRSVTLRLCSEEEEKSVRITQSPIAYRLDVSLPEIDLTSLTCEKDTLFFGIETNTSWSVSLKEGSTIKATIDSTSGKYSSLVKVAISENIDRFSKKKGILVFKATGCNPLEIEMTQLEGLPYFRILSDTQYTAVPGIDNAIINIQTNVDYNCEVVECVGFDASRVKTSSGSSTDTTNQIQFGYCCDFSTEGFLKVKYSSPDLNEPIYVTITQLPVLRMLFGNPDLITVAGSAILSPDYWPFSTPVYSKVSSSKKNAISPGTQYELTLKNGYKVIIYSIAGIWKNSATGFMFGGKVGDWLQFPAVEGYRLVKFDYCYRGSNPIGMALTDTDGKIVVEGLTTGGQGSITSFATPNTEAGKAYRIVANNNITFNVADIILYYE